MTSYRDGVLLFAITNRGELPLQVDEIELIRLSQESRLTLGTDESVILEKRIDLGTVDFSGDAARLSDAANIYRIAEQRSGFFQVHVSLDEITSRGVAIPPRSGQEHTTGDLLLGLGLGPGLEKIGTVTLVVRYLDPVTGQRLEVRTVAGNAIKKTGVFK